MENLHSGDFWVICALLLDSPMVAMAPPMLEMIALKFIHQKILSSEASFTQLKILAKPTPAGWFSVNLTQAKVI